MAATICQTDGDDDRRDHRRQPSGRPDRPTQVGSSRDGTDAITPSARGGVRDAPRWSPLAGRATHRFSTPIEAAAADSFFDRAVLLAERGLVLVAQWAREIHRDDRR